MIGLACMRALAKADFEVIGVGRSMRSANAVDLSVEWIIRDIPTITTEGWWAILDGVDVIVNSSGALQDGAKDDLEAIHVAAVERLVEAAAVLSVRIIQISAAGVSETASTAFFRTKARGNMILSSRAANWIILRPTLVLSQEAYGGRHFFARPPRCRCFSHVSCQMRRSRQFMLGVWLLRSWHPPRGE